MTSLTWSELTARQPALTALEKDARQLAAAIRHAQSTSLALGPNFSPYCIWHGSAAEPYGPHHGFKTHLDKYVGWHCGVRDGVLNTQEAYMLAYEHLSDVLHGINPICKTASVRVRRSVRIQKLKPVPAPRQPRWHAHIPTGAGVYVIAAPDGIYKIGMARNIQKRVCNINTHVPFTLILTAAILTDDPTGVEKRLHRQYHDKQVKGEWYRLSDDDIQEISAGAEHDPQSA